MAARKQADVATDSSKSGIGSQRVNLSCQAVAVHQVVGVHTGNEGRAAPLQPSVQGGNDAPVGRADDLETRVTGGEVAGAGKGVVQRAVIDDHAVPSRLDLALHTTQAGRQGLRGVPGRQQDGYTRIGCGGHVFRAARRSCTLFTNNGQAMVASQATSAKRPPSLGGTNLPHEMPSV